MICCTFSRNLQFAWRCGAVRFSLQIKPYSKQLEIVSSCLIFLSFKIVM